MSQSAAEFTRAGGTFVVMRSQIKQPDVSSGIAKFGNDDSSTRLSILYFGKQKVARRHEPQWRLTRKQSSSRRVGGSVKS